ncbi:exosortase/archaeosortase family protein [Candidatus Bathyarchaeota archaeon]|nr:exosortase/archaeosortase family protein [Candidatus Bathyarchaeota archaeon]
MLNEALNSDLATHILAIPFLVAYICFRIRHRFRALASDILVNTNSPARRALTNIIGILLCAFAYFLRWTGSYSFIPLEYHIASLPIFISGLILLIFNFHVLRALFFPVVFLLFMIPPPVELAQQVGGYLSYYSSHGAYNLLKAVNLPVRLSDLDGNPIIFVKIPSGEEYPFVIDLACSGIYSLIGFLIFALFLAYLVRGPLIKKTAILLLGLPLIYLLNILRITILVIIGFASGPYAALNLFHIFGGWFLILIGTLIILLTSEKLLKVSLFGSEPIHCNDCEKYSINQYCSSCGKMHRFKYNFSRLSLLKIISILAISIILIFIQVPVYNLTNGSAEIFIKKYSGEVFTTNIFPKINGYELKFVYRDTSFEEISGQDAALMYMYAPRDPSKPLVWVGLEIGPAKANLHTWEVCLITYPQSLGREPSVIQLDSRDIKLLDNPPLTARYFAFIDKKNNFTETILYWYTKSVFRSEGEYVEKWSKISVIKLDDNPSDYLEAEEEIYPFAKSIAEYWQPVVTWSKFALVIAYHGVTLLLLTGSFIIASTGVYLYGLFSEKRHAKIMFNKINNIEDKTILEIIKNTENDVITEKYVSLKFVERLGKQIDEDNILAKLLEAEKNGLIERKIISLNDNPYITWKAKF